MLFSYGISAVILFFIISGFSIDYSLDKIKSKDISIDSTMKDFYFRRLVRIYIPYLLALIFSLVTLHIIGVINVEFVKGAADSEIYQLLKKTFSSSFNISFIFDSIFYNFFGSITGNGLIKDGVYIGGNNPFWSLNIEVFFYIIAPVLLLLLHKYILIISLFLGLLIGIFDIESIYLNQYIVSFLKWFPFFIIGIFLRRNLKQIVAFMNIKRVPP